MNSDGCLHILLVDDDEEEFLILQDMLANRTFLSSDRRVYDFRLDWARDFASALDKFNAQDYDLYLIDCYLGPCSGLDLLPELQKNGSLKPVIVLTGQESEEMDIAAVQAGASDYLIKGHINALLLERSIRYAMRQKQDEHLLRLAHDELSQAHAELEKRVIERTFELAETNRSLQTEVSVRKQAEEANARLYHDLQKVLEEEQEMRAQLVQAEKHTAMSRMVASVAHELNNPIQTIQNCLFLARGDLGPESPVIEFIEIAVSEARRVANLVNHLREIYRPVRLGPLRPVRLLDLLAEVQSLLSPHLQFQNVDWEQIPGDEDLSILGNPDQLKQVFMNLCLNAIEAMQPAGGKIRVETGVQPGSGMASIIFADNGPGIPLENQLKIFEPFFTTKEGGTGLGLPISYEIVQRHHGHITLQSDVGKGAAFTVWLPVAVEES